MKECKQVAHFQVGCIMEPTLNRRLTDFLPAISQSPARTIDTLILQTNRLPLYTHDAAKIVAAGVANLSVSLDVADPFAQKELRGGMSLPKVARNIKNFRKCCPDISLEIISVVTTSNIDKMPGLVDLAINLGANRVVFRELLYYPESGVVDHSRMPALLLRSGEFKGMEQSI